MAYPRVPNCRPRFLFYTQGFKSRTNGPGMKDLGENTRMVPFTIAPEAASEDSAGKMRGGVPQSLEVSPILFNPWVRAQAWHQRAWQGIWETT